MQTGAVNEQVMDWAIAWRDAPWGQKDGVMDAASKVLGKSPATLHRWFKELVSVRTKTGAPRKRRADAGETAMTREEAMVLSTALMEHHRANGKRTLSTAQALKNLRASGLLRAERIDPETGEVFLLSASTALRQYVLHPTQLNQPEPVMRLRSDHPNHVWQIDASRCVLYYLPRPGSPESGLQIADYNEFYKNKPDNLKKAMNAAIWRYCVTDHASGWLYVQYVLGGETAANVIDVFIGAMQQRERQVLHGVPKMVMLDPGSANKSAAFDNVCSALRVRVHINEKGNPRAKGQVEKAQDIVECQFESGLRTLPLEEVKTLAQINALATLWLRDFNGTAVHSRHGQTRDAAWMKIKPDELITAPPAALLRQMAVSAPEQRVVNDDMTVKFQGKVWDVSAVPGVLVRQKLFVCRNAFDETSAQALGHSEDGKQTFHVLPVVMVNEYGHRVDAPVIGESYKRHADTQAQVNAREVERLAMGVDTDEDAKKARKQRAAFLGGRYKPFAATEQTIETMPIPLPRRGQAHGLEGLQPQVRNEALFAPMLTHIQAARRLKDLLKTQFGEDWTQAHYEEMKRLYPEVVPEDRLDDVVCEILTAMGATPNGGVGMRLVASGGARRPVIRLVK